MDVRKEAVTFCEHTVDFKNLESMAFTVPLSYKFYRRQEKVIESWKELYAEILKDFARISSACFDCEADNTAIPESEIGDLKASKQMKKPQCVRRGVYVETSLSTESMLRRIRDLLSLCDMEYKMLQIKYYVDEEKKKTQQLQREEASKRQKVYTLDWDLQIEYVGSAPISYRYDNRRTRKIEMWADVYLALITDLALEYPKRIRHGTSFGNRRKIDICSDTKKNEMRRPRRITDSLMLETFGTATQLIERMYQAMILCRVDPKSVVIKFQFDDPERERQFVEQLDIQKKTSIESEIDVKLRKKCRFILKKHFENGFRVYSTIDQNRFRELFQKKYGELLPENNESFLEIVQSLGMLIDGRVYIRKDNAYQVLIEEIAQEVKDTFLLGASCIYLDAILQRNKARLSEQAGIYTIDSLGELLLRELGSAYTIKYDRICYGRRAPDVEGEIIDILKKAKVSVLAAEIIESFWYFPKEKINHVLQNTESIVSVVSGSYYYAPCLPITRDEKAEIQSGLRSLLQIQGSFTEIELLSLVLQSCPNLLTEVSFLSWKGLRNSLAYLFRHVFSFDGALGVPRKSIL